ncbi:hypothetical protein CPB86DRAFT_787353 [Serendipita vermifera]|nr:hypothetical protein CPB86DRAFT_787353 [Serendipita vermifera]
MTSLITGAIQRVVDLLGPPQNADQQDEVWLMDNTAVRLSATDDWKAEYVVAFFSANEDIRQNLVNALAELAQTLQIAPGDDATEARMKERIAPFLRQIGPNKEVDLQYSGNGGTLHLGPSGNNGIYSGVETVPLSANTEQGDGPQPGTVWTMNVVRSQRESESENSPTAHLQTGKTFFVEDGGWGVISDIDDTIKITEVRDRTKILQHTFIDEPTAVQGMSDLYKRLQETLSTASHPSPFMYLSASPYNLYPLLRGFIRDAGFPGGTVILRDMSWMDMESFILSLTMGTKEYKTDRMEKIGSWLPRTTWVCIGDSTQTDPEAYADFYAYCERMQLGGRVARIWIHKVVGVNPSEEKDLNAPERFEKAFENIPRNIWKVFENAEELNAEFEALKKDVDSSSPPPPAQSNLPGL